jgi:hypothetical protein
MMQGKEVLTPDNIGAAEKQPITREVASEPEVVPRELKSWMEKLETQPQANTLIADPAGTPKTVSPSDPGNKVMTLPATRKTFVSGFRKTVDEAGRWLSTFIFKIVKKHDGKVKFKEE